MSGFKRKLQRAIQKNKVKTRGEVFVTRSMIYECEECGRSWRMYLQEGLESHGADHKPVPFSIRCSCGGMAQHVRWYLDEKYNPAIAISDKMDYFANYPWEECGVPILSAQRKRGKDGEQD